MEEMNEYQQYIHISRYARWDPALKRRETLEETVDRYLTFFSPRIPEQVDGQSREAIVAELREYILGLKVLPSMRCFMTAGKALENNEIAGYNCSYVAVDDVKVFSEILMINMNGTGVGFSCERQNINKLPTIAEEFYETDTTIVVKDSKMGWATAFHELLLMLWAGRIPKWDLSLVRPAGAPLKTFGGRASGPEPLDRLFKYCVRLFKTCAGRKLTSLEVHDLVCSISACTIAGGVRRAALISLSNLSDDRMRGAKNGQWWIESPNRSFANNSAAYTERPNMEIFLKEWMSLIESKSGERGIFNRAAAARKAKKYGKREFEGIEFGTNPCLPGDTWVLTSEGPRQIAELVGIPSNLIINGTEFPATGFWSTGIKPVYKINTNRGFSIEATDNHRFQVESSRKHSHGAVITSEEWKEVKDLRPGDKLTLSRNWGISWGGEGTRDEGYLVGSTVSDGTKNALSALERNSSEFIAGFLSGLFDSDGCVINEEKGSSVCLSQLDIGHLELVQRMLARLGIASTIQTTPELIVSGDNIRRFQEVVGFRNKDKAGKLDSITNECDLYKETFTTEVVSVELVGSKEVFDCTVDTVHAFDANGLISHNCGEITLRSAEFCNLSEVVIRPKDTREDVLKKIRIATIIGTLQSTLTNFKYLRKIWKRNCEEERLLGVSLTGICDNPFFARPSDELVAFLNEARELVASVNAVWAEALGINPSVATTCIKPSGTVSQLVDSSSGIHPRYAKYYIRRVRNDKKDPLTRLMIDMGIPYEQDKVSIGSMIFQFPIKSPDSIFRDDKTAIEQLETYLCYSENWTEHNPSITVYVKEHEWLEVGAFVYKHFDKMNGVSFLPHNGSEVYDQAPYEEITEEQYNKLAEAFPKNLDWSRLSEYELEDTTIAMQEMACSGASGCDLEGLMTPNK
jgi:ribonucleotide reductase alpha subunit